MTIKILNLNPSYDHWVVLTHPPDIPDVVRGERAISLASGKGLNMARTLKTLSYTNYCCLNIVGGCVGKIIEESSLAEKLKVAFFRIDEESRINTILIREYLNHRENLVINEPGPSVTAEQVGNFFSFMKRQIHPKDPLVLSGRPPQNYPVKALVNQLRYFSGLGCPLKVDIAGEMLKQVINLPLSLLKINEEELSTAFGITGGDTQALSLFLKRYNIPELIITLGSRGALYCSPGKLLRATFSKAITGPAIGSGDSFFAGWLEAESRQLPTRECLTQAMACGGANLLCYGASLFTIEDMESIKKSIIIEDIK